MNLIMACFIREVELEGLLRVSYFANMARLVDEVPVMRVSESGPGREEPDAHTRVP